MAGHHMAFSYGNIGGFYLRTDILGHVTAGMKAAAGGRVHGAWDIPLQEDFLADDIGVPYGDSRQQGFRIGMTGVLKKLIPAGHLHDLTQVHDGNPVADMAHHSQVMRDEEIGEVKPFLQLFQRDRPTAMNPIWMDILEP